MIDKKKLIWGIGLVLFAIALMLFFLLSRPSGSYLNVLPRDAKAVLRLDLSSLTKELGLSDKEVEQLLEKWEIDDTGADLTSPSYGFVSNNGFLGMVIPVDKSSQLEDFFEESGHEAEKQRGYKWVTLESWLLCFDNSKCLVMGPASMGDMGQLRNQMVAMMEQEEHEVKGKKYLDDIPGPIALYSELDVLPQAYSSFIINLLPKEVNLSEVGICSGLYVTSQALVMENKLITENKQVMSFLQTLNDMARPIRGDMIHYRPESPFLFATANLVGEKLLELLRQNKTIRTYLLGLNMMVDADMMIRSIDGDVSVTMPQFRLHDPEFLFSASLSNQDFLKNVDSWKTGLANSFGVDFRVLRDNDFYLQAAGEKGYFGVRDNKLYLTTSNTFAEEALRSASNEDLEKRIPSMQSCKLYVTMDVRKSRKEINPLGLMLLGMPYMNEFLNEVENLEISSSDFSDYKLTIETSQDIKDIIRSILLQ